MNTKKTTGTPEQLAAMSSTLFFNICEEWKLSDSYLSKFLEISPLKLKSLKRKSAYFSESQMLKVGMVLKLYNNITKLVGETKESKGSKTRSFLYSEYEEVTGGTLIDKLNQPGGLQIVVDFVDSISYAINE